MKLTECCEKMEECLTLWSQGKPGLVKVSYANRKTGKLRHGIGYKKTGAMKAIVYEVDYCPFCGRKFEKGKK